MSVCPFTDNPDGDYPEDSAHENGNYSNKCAVCGNRFIGNKRRYACRRCAAALATKVTNKKATHR